MALFSIKAGQYRGYMQFFNKNSVNGKMGMNEIAAILAKHDINASPNQLQAIIRSVSVDGSGIDAQGFLDYLATYKEYRDQDYEFVECFRIFDKQASGKIRREEVKHVMEKLGNDKLNLDELMDQVDTNRDGFIDYDEFVALMQKY